MQRVLMCVVFLSTVGCGAEVDGDPGNGLVRTEADELRRSADFDVSFTDCVESIGVTLSSTELVDPLVPAEFVVAGTGTPVTPLVVRTASCEGISVDGRPARAGSVMQIGAVIVPPDGTGDIDNYTLRYFADDRRLVAALRGAGLAATKARIGYQLGDANGAETSLDVAVRPRGDSPLSVGGTVTPVSTPAGSFLANWWTQTQYGALKMSTNVPVIAIGSAELSLQLASTDELAALFGATTVEFPILQQFNAFAAAEMHVTKSD
jgi:hypothetical protein